jgi:hypothetical protein
VVLERLLVTALEEDCEEEEEDDTGVVETMLEELWALDETEDAVPVETDDVAMELVVVLDNSKAYPPTAAIITMNITTTATITVEIPRRLP